MEELYNKLFEAGEYTKSFDEFVQQYGDAEKSEKLFKGLSQTGDYTKSFEEFKSQYGFAEKKKLKFHFRRGRYGIHYKCGNKSFLFGFFVNNNKR